MTSIDSLASNASSFPIFLEGLEGAGLRPLPLEANAPLLLDDPAFVYIVCTGKVDVFALRLRESRAVSPRRHLLRVETGEAFFGIRFLRDGESVGLQASGLPGTTVIRIPRTDLQVAGDGNEWTSSVAKIVEHWVQKLSTAVAEHLRPSETVLLMPETAIALPAGVPAGPHGGVVWVAGVGGERSQVSVADRDDVQQFTFGLPLPLSEATWIRTATPARLHVMTTSTWMEMHPDWAGLLAFEDWVLATVASSMTRSERAEEARLEERADSDRAAVQSAMVQIAAVMDPTIAGMGSSETRRVPLLVASRLVAEATGIDFSGALQAHSVAGELLSVPAIARHGGFRYRDVTLEGRWWTNDNGPLLAFLAESGDPVALLQHSTNSYLLHDPTAGTVTRVTEEVAGTLATQGIMFYRPFPPKAMNALDLIRFGARGLRREFATILGMGILVGLLGLAVPIITRVIFDTVVPDADRSHLLTIGFLLVSIAVAGALFQIVQSIAVLRVEGRLDASIQAAVWDRVLALPVSFFRGYSAGDLAIRAMGFTLIRQTISGPIITTFLVATFSLFNLVLLFYYSVSLALLALLLLIIAISVTGGLGYAAVRHQRAILEIEGQISGLVLQIISGIAKFRVSGAEDRAFGLWAERFAGQRRIAFRARSLQTWLLVFNSVYSIFAGLAIFGVYAASGNTLSPGQFISFNVAFIQVLASGLQLTSVFMVIFAVVPLYERATSILAALPERDPAKASPGVLTGDIEVSHVTFRYAADGPPILDDVSIAAKPGEMVAIVGPSGSGKSTLLRLLMGFEHPESGAVYYSGQDLATLDIQEVRRQIGTVIQSGKVMAGSILNNIVGSDLLTLEDAWDAARMAGLDSDIKAMPMGMHTVVSEEGGTFSGGQRQRLLIARAVARRPRILFFDEATSALDNATQDVVSKSLEGLNATRLIIAHRLSTIVNADRIYVMQAGKIVQSGTYAGLLAVPGPFADLARRQVI